MTLGLIVGRDSGTDGDSGVGSVSDTGAVKRGTFHMHVATAEDAFQP